MALLEIKGLNKRFGGIHAVSDCTFSVDEGAIVSLIGPNGAGKTTVFNMVSGLYPPDSGAIFFDGERINEKMLDEEVMIVGRVEVMLNVNTPEDLELVRAIIQSIQPESRN